MLIEKIKINNLLSFGPDSKEIELGPLNVLIGPNGSGKSNFIDAINILKWTTSNQTLPKYLGGGVSDWKWKYYRVKEEIASISTTILSGQKLDYSFFLDITEKRVFVYDELKETSQRKTPIIKWDNKFSKIKIKKVNEYIELDEGEYVEFYDFEKSLLSQMKEPKFYRELFLLSRKIEKIVFYRDWSVGRKSEIRLPQKLDLPGVILEENGSNLGLVLNKYKEDHSLKMKIVDYLNRLYPDIEDYNLAIEGGSGQLYFIEKGCKIPATRLSDGTLRYLCLLAILLNPTQPSLICIEEPELGLHPDVLPTIANLLKEASEKTQLIVTTHSDILVDALTDTPESILVCDKENGSTVMKRLEADKLKIWLKEYSLGNLWTSGQIGGTRW